MFYWRRTIFAGDAPYKVLQAGRNKYISYWYRYSCNWKSKKGIYDEKAISKVPIEFLDRFFENYHKSYKIKDEIKNTVRFERIDLLKDPFPKHMDLILCRNVIIYFTSEAKDMIYTKFYNSLNDNGILFVGSTEQILTPEKYSFKPVKTFFYTKYER